jgi:hypothetical protein
MGYKPQNAFRRGGFIPKVNAEALMLPWLKLVLPSVFRIE